MKRAQALRSSAAFGAFWRVAMLGAAMAVGAAAPADAAFYYWQDSLPGYYNQQQVLDPPRRQQRARRGPAKKGIIKDTAVHPQMPLIINVSIARQRVRVYDANGFFAESPVSTGMPGHLTPMGVFSVIQKDRYHHSNIYSGAPMPYMQRITWGGVALHAGVVPGRPASHGCIRMPESFAVKMWGWTKLGARVIVSPGELSLSSFEHALLPTMKIAPHPQVSEPTNLELRSTVGHNDEPAQREKTRTADASRNAQRGSTILSDASTAGSETSREAVAKADDSKAESPPAAVTVGQEAADASDFELAASPKTADTAGSETRPDTPKSEAVDDKKDQRLSGSDKPPKPDARRKDGQFAVLISRKDSKLYVRQNFAPAWEIPVTIAASDRPLGTHVFTATVDRSDSNLLRWSVITVPMSVRAAMRASHESLQGRHRGRAAAAPVEKAAPLPDSPAEALDRITIAPEVMARISAAMTNGGSIIVSDQGINQGETGEYTDFIIRTY